MSCGANGGGSGDGAPEETARTVKSIASGAAESEICEALAESKMDPNDAALRLPTLVHTREASNQEPSPPGDPLSTDIGGETSGAVDDASSSAPQRPGVQSGVGKKGKKRNIPLYTVGSAAFGFGFSNPSPVSERTTQQSDNAADQRFNLHEWPEVGHRTAVTRSSALDVSVVPDAESNSSQPGLCIDGSDVQVSEEGVSDITESTCDFSTRDVTNDAGEGETSHCDDKTVKDESSHEPPEVPYTESNSNQPGLCIDDVQVSEEGVGRGGCGADLNESTRDSSTRDVTNNAGETSHCDDNTVKDESSHEPPEGIDSCTPSASVELERLSLGEENHVRSPGRGACEATSEQELQAFDGRVSHLVLDAFKPGDALNPQIGEVSSCSSSGCFYGTRDETGNAGDFYSPRTGLLSDRAFEATYVHGCVCPFLAPVADRSLGDQPCSPLSTVPITVGFLESGVDSLNDYDPGLVESSMSEAVRSGAPFQQRQQNQSYQSYGGVSLHRSMSDVDQFQGGASSSRLPVMSDASVFHPFSSCPDIHGSLQRSLLSIAPAPIQDAGLRAVPPVPAQNQQHPGYWQNNERTMQQSAAAPGYPDYYGPQEYQQQQHGIGQSSRHQRHTAPPGYVSFYQPRAEFWIAQEHQQLQPRFVQVPWLQQQQQQRTSLPGGHGFHQQQQRAAPRGYQQRGHGNGQRSQQEQQRLTFQEYQRELVDDWTAEQWRNNMSPEQLQQLHRRRYGY